MGRDGEAGEEERPRERRGAGVGAAPGGRGGAWGRVWGKAQWEARSKGGVGIKVARRWCLHRRRGSAGASVRKEESQMELQGSLGRSLGMGGRGLFCAKAFLSNFTSQQKLQLSSGERSAID